MASGAGCYLSTADLYRLDLACRPLRAMVESPGGIYLVGSASERPDFRDVDVRMILPDEQFDDLFRHQQLWELFSYAVSRQLSADTGLPVDFQVQRQTEANDEHTGLRNPLGRGRSFAGGGDATRFTAVTTRRAPDTCGADHLSGTCESHERTAL